MPLAQTTTASIWYADHRDPTLHRPVTLFVHGAGGTHLDWPAELRRLPEANALIVDLPAHGRSPAPGRSSINAYAADILALMDSLSLPQAIIAGHSMGAAIAQTIALNYPDRVQGLILIGAGAKLGVHPDILNGLLTEAAKTIIQLVSLYYGSGGTDSMRRRSIQRLMEFNPTILHNDYAACEAFDVRERVGQIKIPTLIFGGTHDRLVPYKHSQYLQEQITDSQLVEVKGAGHFMTIEQPAFIAEAVQKWLLEQWA